MCVQFKITVLNCRQFTMMTSNVSGFQLPIFGLPGKKFFVIHISALVSIGISDVISLSVLTYALCSKSVSLWKRPIGERLTVYIAASDLIQGITHGSDHVYMLSTQQHVPDVPCTIFAYVLFISDMSQSILVMMVPSCLSYYL